MGIHACNVFLAIEFEHACSEFIAYVNAGVENVVTLLLDSATSNDSVTDDV